MNLNIFSLLTLNLLTCGSSTNIKSPDAPMVSQMIPKVEESIGDTTRSKSDTITIIGVGDIMLGTNFPTTATLPPDARGLLEPLKSTLSNASITFGNVEGVFLDEGGIPKGSGKNVYCFRQPEAYAQHLKDVGFDALSVANNHINDFGALGLVRTQKTLEALGVPFAGFSHKPDTSFMLNGVRYGLAAFAPHSGCADFMDLSKARDIVSKLAKTCDVVIVSFHAGAEGSNAQHVPRMDEEFLGQNRGNVYEFSHAMVDAGASVVFGHGPHVTRAVELYRNRLIAYSLGNFCTYAKFNLKGPNGVAPLLKVYTTTKGEFIKAEVVSIKQEGEGGPIIDYSHTAFEYLKSLTEEDFPETPLRFVDHKYIYKK